MAARRSRRRAAPRSAALAAGLAFAWFAPTAEAVAWIAARFDGMALFWMLVAACAFMASREWRDRYGLASLAATVLAFMSKESAAIGPALIVALAWVKRPDGRRPAARRRARARRRVAVAGDRGGVFRVPDVDLRRPVPLLPGHLAGHWRCCPGSGSPRCRRAATGGRSRCPRRDRAGLTPSPACCSPSPRFPPACATAPKRRVLAAIVLALLAALALLFSHWGWSATGEGGRVLYAPAAIAALAVALPLRSPERRFRLAAWIVAVVLLGSGLLLTRGAVERRVQAGARDARADRGAGARPPMRCRRFVRVRHRSRSPRRRSRSRAMRRAG